MTVMEKISGYFKQFVGEVSGSQPLYDEGRREAAQASSDPLRGGAGWYEEKDEQVVPVEPRIVPGETGVVSAETGYSKTVQADAVPQFATSMAGSVNDGRGKEATVHQETSVKKSPVGSRERAAISGAPHATADVERLKLYRLVPVAAPGDTNWDNAMNQGEVVVRARTAGDARVVAAEAELDFTEIDSLPGDGNSTTFASAFRNERLYTVLDETTSRYPLEGPREVVEGNIRVDNIRPTEL